MKNRELIEENLKLEERYNGIPTTELYMITAHEGEVYEIWKQYKQAMEKRRPDSVLEWERFYNYVMDIAMVYEHKGSYVFGQYEGRIFVPTHFAPKGLRDGIEIIKKMKEYDNVVFVVTEDLKDMLKKLNYKVLPIRTMKEFRDVEVEKSIAVSSLFCSAVLSLHGVFEELWGKVKSGTIKTYDKIVSLFKRKLNWNKSEISAMVDEEELYNEEATMFKIKRVEESVEDNIVGVGDVLPIKDIEDLYDAAEKYNKAITRDFSDMAHEEWFQKELKEFHNEVAKSMTRNFNIPFEKARENFAIMCDLEYQEYDITNIDINKDGTIETYDEEIIYSTDSPGEGDPAPPIPSWVWREYPDAYEGGSVHMKFAKRKKNRQNR